MAKFGNKYFRNIGSVSNKILQRLSFYRQTLGADFTFGGKSFDNIASSGVPVYQRLPSFTGDEFNTPTYGVKLQLRNWITARLGHTDWVLIDAQRCEAAGGQWYTDLGLGAFPFPSNDSRTGTYMTNFFGYGIQNCRDVSSGYDSKASMLQALKVTLNNESNREVIIPVENYYDNSVTVSSYDGI